VPKVLSIRPKGLSSWDEEKRALNIVWGRAAIGYEHGYDGKVFYLELALDPAYVEGFVEGCLERNGEEDSDEEEFLRGTWEEGDDHISSLRLLRAGWRSGRGDLHYRSSIPVILLALLQPWD
jgi:hypothetical protein